MTTKMTTKTMMKRTRMTKRTRMKNQSMEMARPLVARLRIQKL
jgi:hypothetical protein